MKENYHTHTFRCHHASGTEREYVENAIRAGMRVLGFSDHTPQIFPGDYYSTMRMRPDELDDYIGTLSALREEYKNDIEIRIGLEVEYYPHIFPALCDLIRGRGIEYMILAQHWLGDEQGYDYNSNPIRGDEATRAQREVDRLRQYVDQVTEGMHTGLFTYIAHPDLVRFDGDEETYRKYMEPMCREARELGLPLEINMLGVMGRRNYPCDRFFRLAKEVGCRFILGMDAHQPEVIVNRPLLAETMAFCDRLGIVPEETVALVDPNR